MEGTNGVNTCTCGRDVVPAILTGTDTRLCKLCWRRAFAWEHVQRASDAYNAAIADYVLNTVPSRDVKLLVALHHAKRAYQEARAAEAAARG